MSGPAKRVTSTAVNWKKLSEAVTAKHAADFSALKVNFARCCFNKTSTWDNFVLILKCRVVLLNKLFWAIF